MSEIMKEMDEEERASFTKFIEGTKVLKDIMLRADPETLRVIVTQINSRSCNEVKSPDEDFRFMQDELAKSGALGDPSEVREKTNSVTMSDYHKIQINKILGKTPESWLS